MPPAQQKSKKVDDGESDCETLDLNVSDTSTSDGGAEAAPAVIDANTVKTGNQPDVTPGNLPVPPTLAPLLPSATGRTNRAHDIDYFFSRGSRADGSLTICKQCR